LAVARASEAAVRESGAIPATVAVHDGRIRVGLGESDLEALATAPAGSVLKAARPSLARALAGGGWAATTVSATMLAAYAAGIRVFATGGIGGVHRGALAATAGRPASFDISADLEELARTPVAVVCAGPKAILDVPATLEYLETRGVPVLTIGQTELPGFYARSSGIPSPLALDTPEEAARVAAVQLDLGLGGILLCVPAPDAEALPAEIARDAVERAIADAESAGVSGPALTPWLLARIAHLTEGASIRANTALIVNDARVAGEVAAALGVNRAR
jgi:pseudouridine-5'-phosphate glycosidase